MQNYYVYITTNYAKHVLYTGITNSLRSRMNQHYDNRGKNDTFAGKYYCYNLIYFEIYHDVNQAIAREKEIKGWTRAKKVAMIEKANPTWKFLNNEI